MTSSFLFSNELMYLYAKNATTKRMINITVRVIIILFLLHLRSSMVVIIMLPVAILMSFICMHLLNVSSNIMSISGIAIAIGVIVDAGIVMVENAHRHLTKE